MLKVGDKVLWRYGKSKDIKEAGEVVSVENWPLIKVLFPGNVSSTIPQDDLIKVEGGKPSVECIRRRALSKVPPQSSGPHFKEKQSPVKCPWCSQMLTTEEEAYGHIKFGHPKELRVWLAKVPFEVMKNLKWMDVARRARA